MIPLSPAFAEPASWRKAPGERGIIGIIFYLIVLIFPEPKESDHDEKDWQKIGPDDSWDRKMERVILRSQNEDPNDYRDPTSQTFSIAENASCPKGNDDPWPSFP
jgi:hypothetical protein